MFDSEEIPFDSVHFMTGHINYGGRVTDDNDRILLISLLQKCYGRVILDAAYFKEPPPAKRRAAGKKGPRATAAPELFTFFGQAQYRIPAVLQTLEDIYQYVGSLPDTDIPEIFGMHQNANISYQQTESNNLIKTILNIKMQPVVSGKKKSKRDPARGDRGAGGEKDRIADGSVSAPDQSDAGG
jgi:dynein heavy chain